MTHQILNDASLKFTCEIQDISCAASLLQEEPSRIAHISPEQEQQSEETIFNRCAQGDVCKKSLKRRGEKKRLKSWIKRKDGDYM